MALMPNDHQVHICMIQFATVMNVMLHLGDISDGSQDELPKWLQSLGHETLTEMTAIIDAAEKGQGLLEVAGTFASMPLIFVQLELTADDQRDRRIRRQTISRIVRDLVDNVLQHLRVLLRMMLMTEFVGTKT